MWNMFKMTQQEGKVHFGWTVGIAASFIFVWMAFNVTILIPVLFLAGIGFGIKGTIAYHRWKGIPDD